MELARRKTRKLTHWPRSGALCTVYTRVCVYSTHKLTYNPSPIILTFALSLSLFLSVSTCLSVCPSVLLFLSVCISLYLSLDLSAFLSRSSLFSLHHQGISDVAWSADSRYLATASDDTTVKIWDVQAVTSNTPLLYIYICIHEKVVASSHAHTH